MTANKAVAEARENFERAELERERLDKNVVDLKAENARLEGEAQRFRKELDTASEQLEHERQKNSTLETRLGFFLNFAVF